MNREPMGRDAQIRWIGRRVALGMAVSVEIVQTGLGVRREEAEALLAADWPSVVHERREARCPRPGCGRQAFRSHDELFCIVHGTFYTPFRATDLPGADTSPSQRIRKRISQATAGPAWTPDEIAAWAEEGVSIEGVPTVEHGSFRVYASGCRCELCNAPHVRGRKKMEVDKPSEAPV